MHSGDVDSSAGLHLVNHIGETEDVAEMVSRLTRHGAQLVGEIVQYENSYRLCYIRGTEGLLIGLAEEIGNK